MFDWNIFWLAVTGVILFLFSIEKFTNDVQRAGGEKFKAFFRKITSSPLRGTVAGATITGVVQSSAVTTVIAAGLVSSGVLTFFNSLGIIFGANIGTTITAQLVALNVTTIAPFFIIIGFFIRFFGEKYRLIGKAIFYFGLVFFSLNLISIYVSPLANSGEVVSLFSSISNLAIAILIGIIFTFLVQSSSITSGLVVVLVGSALLDINQAVGIILGANIGSTTTGLIASISMNKEGKRTAIAHFLFNLIGLLIILPVFTLFVTFVQSLGGSAQQVVANVHLIFNISMAILFLIFVKPYYKLLMKIYP